MTQHSIDVFDRITRSKTTHRFDTLSQVIHVRANGSFEFKLLKFLKFRIYNSSRIDYEVAFGTAFQTLSSQQFNRKTNLLQLSFSISQNSEKNQFFRLQPDEFSQPRSSLCLYLYGIGCAHICINLGLNKPSLSELTLSFTCCSFHT